MKASGITWEDLRNISSEGKAELRAAGLSPETGQALQAFGYTQAGDLQYITDQLQSVCVRLPIIQAAKLRKLVEGAPSTSAPRGATAARTMQSAGQPSKPSKHSQHQLLPAHVFDTARRLKPSPYSLEVTVLCEDCGGVKGLVDMLSSKDEAAVSQAAWALMNLAAGSNDQRDSILSAGAVGPLVALLSGGSLDIQEQAACVLRTLLEKSVPAKQATSTTDFKSNSQPAPSAADEDGEQDDSHKQRAEEVAQAGAIAPLIALLSRGSSGAQEQAAEALLCLAVSSDKWMARVVATGAMPPLVAMLSGGGAGAQAQAARTIGGMQEAAPGPIAERIVALNAIEPLVALLSNGSNGAQAGAASVLADLVHDFPNDHLNEELAERVIAAGAIDPLVALLSSDKTDVQGEAAYLVGVLAMRSKSRCAKILAAGAMAPLYALTSSHLTHVSMSASVALEEISHLEPGPVEAAHRESHLQLAMLLAACLSDRDERSQMCTAEALPCLLKRLEEDADLCVRAVAEGAIVPLVALSRGLTDVSFSATKALRALACGSEEHREAIIAGGGEFALEECEDAWE